MTAAPRSPFSIPTFRRLWTANLGSSFGALIQAVGAAWMMTMLTPSVDMVALVQSAGALPVVFLSLIGGAIADGYNKRKVMIASQSFMMAVSVALTIFAYFGGLNPWLLLGFTFLLGCGNAINNPSWQASMGDIVPREQLPAAVSINSIGFNIARSVGPALGGIIVGALGAVGAFAINAVTYIGPITALSRWQAPVRERTLPPEPIGAAIVSGLRYVSLSPHLMRIMARAALFGFGSIIILALLPVVAARQIVGGPLTYGILLGCYGVGAVGGALLGPKLQQRTSSERIISVSALVSVASILLLGTAHHLALAMIPCLLAGGIWVICLSLFNVSVQLSAPRWVTGRALSLYQTSVFGGIALGSWVWGAVAERNGLWTAFIAAAAAMLLCAAIGLLMPMPPRAKQNLDPSGHWQTPTVDLDLTARSGPIVVQVVYEIPPENLDAFLALMNERKRMRRRDGARNWTLSRDLAQPRRWVERYKSPTWTDYIRQNQRITQADAEIGQKLRALYAEGTPPQVSRLLEQHDETHVGVLRDHASHDNH